MQAEIKKHHAVAEYETDERCHITEIANHAGDADVSIARARVEPGVTTAWHRLNGICERYIIISGQGRVEIDDQAPVDVQPGDVVIIPPQARQRIANTGSTDLIFYCVCSPRFQQIYYESLE